MASGALDVNSIWQYGESDLEATFSELLNVGQEATSLAVGALKTRATSLEASRDNPTVYVANSAAARNAKWGTPANAAARRALQDKGAITIRTDLGYAEQYFAGSTDGGANPGGTLGAAGWYPILGHMPYVEYRRAAAQSIANGTDTTIDWDASPAVQVGMAAAEAAGVITIPIEGFWHVSATVLFASNATGLRGLHLSKSGTANRIAGVDSSGAVTGTLSLDKLVRLAAGDTIQARVFQSSGGALNITEYWSSGVTAPGLTLRYQGPR